MAGTFHAKHIVVDIDTIYLFPLRYYCCVPHRPAYNISPGFQYCFSHFFFFGRIQRIEKDHGYECHTECDKKTQQTIPEIIINKDMPSRVRAHVTPLHVRNIIGHLSLHGYLREKKN